MATRIVSLTPRWDIVLLKRDKGGYSYRLLCPLQPQNKVDGWHKGNKANTQKMLNSVIKRLNNTIFKVPKHLRSTMNIEAHRKRLSGYATINREKKGAK